MTDKPKRKARETAKGLRKMMSIGMVSPALIVEAADELERLDALIHDPANDDFLESIRTELVHQSERWGKEHDQNKIDYDWFWLLSHLATKALMAMRFNDHNLAKHHTISSAAVLANWHRRIKEDIVISGIDKNCPLCGYPATVKWHDDEFQYGRDDDAVMLKCRVPVITCGKCDEQFLDHEGEKIRDDAVKKHLAQAGQ